ncbi:hypothetical protein J437_LFUL013610 [Ladona fulva]|uniref:Uncharacterized protein n=1 Tax=Ladona fulva TaxID=123851 RepID=A0A8K0K011_LADFU|nr:hypothetical protein J437_LFUL013610 [Ladona fulva]
MQDCLTQWIAVVHSNEFRSPKSRRRRRILRVNGHSYCWHKHHNPGKMFLVSMASIKKSVVIYF